MKKRILVYTLSLAISSSASIGDNLQSFKVCVEKCNQYMMCDGLTIFDKIENEYDSQDFQDEEYGKKLLAANYKRDTEFKYRAEDFSRSYRLSFLTRYLFSWDCLSNCKYQCSQFVTDQRVFEGLDIVQFYGKWPFLRIFGITEFFSAVFSMINFYTNWKSLRTVLNQYHKTSKSIQEDSVMYLQYLYLISGSLVGWTMSTIFHIRDTRLTETLDYFGAALIVLLNFNAIFMRYFNLFLSERSKYRRIFQAFLVLLFVCHCFKLLRKWDYEYNTNFNIFFGIFAIALWIAHSFNVNTSFKNNLQVYSNHMSHSSFENKIIRNIETAFKSFSSREMIPFIPIGLNFWIIVGMLFELWDFTPFLRLLDAHAIWHFFTIFPPLLWYDWNIWDLQFRRFIIEAGKTV